MNSGSIRAKNMTALNLVSQTWQRQPPLFVLHLLLSLLLGLLSHPALAIALGLVPGLGALLGMHPGSLTRLHLRLGTSARPRTIPQTVAVAITVLGLVLRLILGCCALAISTTHPHAPATHTTTASATPSATCGIGSISGCQGGSNKSRDQTGFTHDMLLFSLTTKSRTTQTAILKLIY
jgi:hypothetical protein